MRAGPLPVGHGAPLDGAPHDLGSGNDQLVDLDVMSVSFDDDTRVACLAFLIERASNATASELR
ncbi:hypothetical protein CAI21_19045 [Alkalilimnicola ehrlichii]|nr:hypothetical protein CAI21_19045 [Alkalilimnicola ehrlichii]